MTTCLTQNSMRRLMEGEADARSAAEHLANCPRCHDRWLTAAEVLQTNALRVGRELLARTSPVL